MQITTKNGCPQIRPLSRKEPHKIASEFCRRKNVSKREYVMDDHTTKGRDEIMFFLVHKKIPCCKKKDFRTPYYKNSFFKRSRKISFNFFQENNFF